MFLLLTSMCMTVSQAVCLSLCHMSTVPPEIRREDWIHSYWSYRQLWAPCGCWELNPGLLREQQSVLISPAPRLRLSNNISHCESPRKTTSLLISRPCGIEDVDLDVDPSCEPQKGSHALASTQPHLLMASEEPACPRSASDAVWVPFFHFPSLSFPAEHRAP